MAVCDICSSPGMGTIISARNMQQAVFGKGFNPIALGLVKGKTARDVLVRLFASDCRPSVREWADDTG
jgi:hypothetical protein